MMHEDDYLGNTEIGDSVRGMQDEYVGAAGALQSLRGSLGQLAAGRFQGHTPLNRRIKSQYRDSGQIGINVTSSAITQTSLANWQNVSLSGNSIVYTSFKPNRVVVNEQLLCSYANVTTTTITSAAVVSVADAGDLLLVGAFSGSINNFPNAPSANSGINCSALQAGAFGVGISWPTVNPGIPVTINLLVLPSALARALAAAPTSYTLTSFTVAVYFSMFGPQLR